MDADADLWQEMKQFLDEISRNPAKARAPNPADYAEPSDQSQSFWIREHNIDYEQECATSALPEEVDVVIIGSGISGAAAAYHLAKATPELRVALCEARGICTGATGRNGGHILRPEVYHLRDLAKTFDAEEAIRIRKFAVANRNAILDTVDELGIADKIDLQLKGCIVVFASEEENAAFKADYEFAKAHGMDPECSILSPSEVLEKLDYEPSQARYGAAFLKRSGTMYPRKLVDQLLQAAMRRMPRLSMHAFTPVTNVSRSVSGDNEQFMYTVETTKGTIKARSVLHATNGWANHLIPHLRDRSGVFGCVAHVMAVQPTEPNPARPLDLSIGHDDFWHWIAPRPNNGPLIYGYSTAEEVGTYDDTITIAEDHLTRRQMKDFLELTFPRHFRSVDMKRDVKYDWLGVQGFTSNTSSVVGKPDKDSPGEFVCVGHNGEGMSRCFLSAAEAVNMVLHWLKHGTKESYVASDSFPKSYLRNI